MKNSSSSCDTRQADPTGSACPTENCLIEFDGYWWWTNYPFNIAGTGYWFNDQQWDPSLVTVDSEGWLHLQMMETQLPGGPKQWSSIEVLLWAPSDQPIGPDAPARFYPGYGTYLVAASTTPDFDTLANNCCFGAFTYAFNADSTQKNCHHELDLIEASRFGRPESKDPTNAQFTIQPWQSTGNIHRITLQKGQGDITIVMSWPGPGESVVYSLCYGIFDLGSLPPEPDITWTTDASQNIYIPDDSCQTVHLNLWRQPASEVTPENNQEVIVKKFQFKAS